MSIRPTLWKTGVLLAAALSPAPGVALVCTGPKPLETRVHSHPDADGYVELGTWFGDHNQYACAVQTFQTALKLEPRSGRLYYLIGLSWYSAGKMEQAVGALQKSVRLAPDVLHAHLLLGSAQEQLQRHAEARAEWQAALKIDPKSTVALDGLSKSLIASGEYDSVIEHLQSAPLDENLALDLAQAYDKTGMHDEAGKSLEKALTKNPDSLPLSGALVAVLVREAHFERAAQLAAKSVELHPRNLEAQKLYLHVLVLNDDVDKAKPLADKLLAAAPHDFDALYLNGVLERESGQFDAAKKHLEEAVALNPTHYNCHYNLGVVLAELKDPKGAREHLEKALALGATEPQVRFKLATVLRQLGETQLAQQQLALYQKEHEEKSNRTIAASKSAMASEELAKGDPQKAVALYREAVAASPKDAALLYKLSQALDRIGDVDGQREVLEQVIAIDPDFALAQNQLGYLASRSGDNSTAEGHFRQAVRAAPRYTQAWVSLAATLGMESRFSEAQEAVTTALGLDPANEEALQLRKELTGAQAQR